MTAAQLHDLTHPGIARAVPLTAAQRLAAGEIATLGADFDLGEFWPITARLICAVHDRDPELLQLLATVTWEQLVGALVLACLNVPERLVVNAKNGYEIDQTPVVGG